MTKRPIFAGITAFRFILKVLENTLHLCDRKVRRDGGRKEGRKEGRKKGRKKERKKEKIDHWSSSKQLTFREI